MDNAEQKESQDLRVKFAEWSGMGVEPGHLPDVVMGALRNLKERAERAEALIEPWHPCAQALADEVDVLVRRHVIDSRSPAADALLDVRNPPMSPRSDRLVELERERDEARTKLTECHRLAWPRGGDLNGDPVCDLMLALGTMRCTTRDALAERDEARARVAELERERDEAAQDEKQWNAALRAESDALAKGSDAWMRHVLGADWGRLWGPNLEAFGRGVDELRERAERAEARVAELEEGNVRRQVRAEAQVATLRALARLVIEQTNEDENGDMPDHPRGALLTLRKAALAAYHRDRSW